MEGSLKLLGSGEIDMGLKDSGDKDMNEHASAELVCSWWLLGWLTCWTSIGELVDRTRTGLVADDCWLLTLTHE